MTAILAFETSSSLLSVAVKKGNDKVLEAKVSGFLNHAENLLPVIDRLLKKTKLSIQKIDRFLIGRGPGSFTGLRIGFTTLKGFALLQKKPCFGALSLDLIAENAELPENSTLAVCLDARRERIYSRLYKRKKSQWRPEGEPQVQDAESFASSLPDETFLTGNALERYGKGIQERRGRRTFHLLPEKAWHPRASHLVSLYEAGNKKVRELKKPADFVPLYFRLSEAEEKSRDYAHAR